MTVDEVTERWHGRVWVSVLAPNPQGGNSQLNILLGREGNTLSLTGVPPMALEAFTHLAADFPFLLSKAKEFEQEVQRLTKEAEELSLIISDLREDRGDIFTLWIYTDEDGARFMLATHSLHEAIREAEDWRDYECWITNESTGERAWQYEPAEV